MSRDITRIGVVGLGTMGAGIVEVFARSGYDVVGLDADEAAVARGQGHIEGSTSRAVARGKATEEERQAILGRIRFTTSYDDMSDRQLVIEAVPERLELKRIVFEQLDKTVAPDAILATNTSSLSVTDIAVATQRPPQVVGMHFFNPAPILKFVEAVVEDLAVKTVLFEALGEICKPSVILATTTSSLPVVDLAAATKFPQDVVGLHFFNPAQIMKLVEVVSTVATAEDVVATAVDVCRRLDKHPVTCGDRAGFIVNALLFPYLNDAVKMLEANYASADDIDTAMKTGCGYPMGPFELLDVVGLDVSLAIERTLYLEFREPGFAPAPRLEHLVTAGYLGRKSGRGFRSYDA